MTHPQIPTQGIGPFMNLQEAAAFCGYTPRYFARVLKAYELPRYGPRKNRFARAVLEAWMADPEQFRSAARPRRRQPITLVVPGERPL